MSDRRPLPTDTIDQQPTAMHGETGVTVRHEDLQGCEAANSTMPGGLHASADVTNVQAEYN
jgi:hypothetical protein